jgi:RNA polymerase sigma factor (sigma-70 family)
VESLGRLCRRSRHRQRRGRRSVRSDAHSDEEIEHPASWLWTAGFRIAAGELQRRRREPTREGAPSSYDLPEPVDHLVGALERISPNQRLAVLLHDYADRPTDEIATIMNVTRTTVHVHLSQGRRRLRKLLEDMR